MKKLLLIILAIIFTLSASQADISRETSAVSAQKRPTSALTKSVEPLPAKTETMPLTPCDAPVEAVIDGTEASTTSKYPYSMKESETEIEAADRATTESVIETEADVINESEEDQTMITDKTNTAVIYETESYPECVDRGNQTLAPYTPPSCAGTPNPFANPQPNNVKEIPAEDLIQPGDDRPGEGIHF